MGFYIDPYLILNLGYLVLAHPVDGDGPLDGHYALVVLLHMDNKTKRLWVDYPDAPTRDAALLTMGALLRAEETGQSLADGLGDVEEPA